MSGNAAVRAEAVGLAEVVGIPYEGRSVLQIIQSIRRLLTWTDEDQSRYYGQIELSSTPNKLSAEEIEDLEGLWQPLVTDYPYNGPAYGISSRHYELWGAERQLRMAERKARKG